MKVHDARDGFNDLKPEFVFTQDFPWWYLAAAILVILLLMKYWPKKTRTAVIIRKDLTEFISELKAISAKVKSGEETPKHLAHEASLIIRRYIFDRTKIPVLESTPTEAEILLTRVNRFSSGTAQEVSKLLSQLENISFSEFKGENETIQSKASQLLSQSESLLAKIELRVAETVI